MASRTALPRSDPGWRTTPAFLCAAMVAALLMAAAMTFGRVDLLVLGTPLLIITVWTLAVRPRTAPEISGTVSTTSPVEGTTQAWTLRIDADDAAAEHFAAYVGERRMLTMTPDSGALEGALDDGHAVRTVRWSPRRWGTRQVLDTRVAVYGPWGGFRYGPVQLPGFQVTALPETAAFHTKRGLPHPQGLIGVNRSNTKAEGTEFADIREFQVGDRLRHIHWPVSARTGRLHVRTSFAEQDTEILVVLDASVDHGGDPESETTSSLDLGVRASAGLATHFLGRGDRVGLEVVGGAQPVRVPVGMGTSHRRRVLDCLSGVERGFGTAFRSAAIRSPLRPGGVLLLISPLLSPMPLTLAAKLAARGMTVLVVDCFPGEVPEGDPAVTLALRVRLLEREQEIRAIERIGVPVAQWRGPGSLDPVLTGLAARPAPRVVRR